MQPFETGIQRVTRRLAGGLLRHGVDLVPTGWDPVRRALRLPEAAGRISERDWLLVPEIPLSMLWDDLDPIQVARAYGLQSAAIVHDLIPIRLAHLYDEAKRTLFRRYYRMFTSADLVLATTHLVATHLRDYLLSEGMPLPNIVVVPLPAQFGSLPRVQEVPTRRQPADSLKLLTIATWEPRKNLPQLLRAVKTAQEHSKYSIEMTLVGRRNVYLDLDREIRALAAGIVGVNLVGQIEDHVLARLYSTHHASVYPSCEEGFGMPVLESLWLGRPCLCHEGSAMAEVAPGGGTLMIDMRNEAAIANALIRLAEQPELLDQLASTVLQRPLRTWSDYAVDVVSKLN